MEHDQTPPPERISSASLEKIVYRGLLIFFLAIVVYIPAMSGGFIYDDDILLTQNPFITRGTGFLDSESWKGLGQIWFPAGEKNVSDYAPLASTTLWVEWRLWGNSATGYHITNILLHATAALLLWAVLARIGVPGGWIAALLWAVHPVCVESVAWIAERRNVLSMPMLMLTLLAWLHFQAGRDRRYYWLALALFALALLSKATAVMLPCFLLLWLWWRNGKVTMNDLLESAPFFFFSFLFGMVTVHFQNTAIADEKVAGDLLNRVINASFALGFYFWKALYPIRLSFNYPEWHKTLPAQVQLLPGLAFAGAFALGWWKRASWGRHVILGLGFFALMIVPALGIRPMAYMRISLLADHFEYMPMAGVLALAVAGVAAWWEREASAPTRWTVAAGGMVVAVWFCALTFLRAIVFQEPERLWLDTLYKNPDAWQAHEHLAQILQDKGDLTAALEHFRHGAEIRPDFPETRQNYGNTLRTMGRIEEAIAENRAAAQLAPQNLNAVSSYGDTLLVAGRLDEAAIVYKQALALNEQNPLVYNCLGIIALRTGRTEEAIDYFQRALAYAPGFAVAQQNLALALQKREADHSH